MNRIFLTTLLALALGVAHAEPSTYLSISGGPVFPIISTLSAAEEDVTLKTDVETSTGIASALAVGYADTLGFRGELELGLRKSNLRYLKGTRISIPEIGSATIPFAIPLSGDITTYTLVANGLYVFEAKQLRPYIGLGAGVARHETTIKETALGDDGDLSVEDTDSGDTAFAYQVMAGLLVPMQDDVEMRLGYRCFGTGSVDLDGVELDYGGAHGIEVGVNVRF